MNNDAPFWFVDDEKAHAGDAIEALESSAGGRLRCIRRKKRWDRRQWKIDLIITDLNLRADINGIDILRAAGSDHQRRVILIRRMRQSTRARKAIGRAYDYLVKPIDVDQLRAMSCQGSSDTEGDGVSKDFVFEAWSAAARRCSMFRCCGV